MKAEAVQSMSEKGQTRYQPLRARLIMAFICVSACPSRLVAEEDLYGGVITPKHARDTHRTLMGRAVTRAGNSPISLSFNSSQRYWMEEGAYDEDSTRTCEEELS